MVGPIANLSGIGREAISDCFLDYELSFISTGSKYFKRVSFESLNIKYLKLHSLEEI